MDISSLSPRQRSQVDQIIEKCIVSREYFIRVILAVEYIEEWQLEVIRALDKGETKISIRSGHGVGKTCLVAWLALHFVLFRNDVKIIVTSPSFSQLTDGMRPEIIKWITRCPDWMSSQLTVISDRISRGPNNANNFISFRTARKENPDAIAGVHADHVMILVDEACGVDEVIYETGQGALSSRGAIAMLIGNPTKPTGFFYETQTSLSDLWWGRKVSCLDSTRVDMDYIESQARTYGIESRQYRVRVLGEFPAGGADNIIPRAYVEASVDRDVSPVKGKNTIVWGVDPGRGGDPTGFVIRDANTVKEALELKYEDLMKVVGYVKQRWDVMPVALRPSAIYIDSIGLGAGVADRLLELELPVVHVNVSEASSLSSRYKRLRAELWYKTREWFERKDVCLLSSIELYKKLINELSAVEEILLSNGQVDAESKKDMKKRGVPSPNLADALVMTFAGDGAVMAGSYNVDDWGKVDTSKYRASHVV